MVLAEGDALLVSLPSGAPEGIVAEYERLSSACRPVRGAQLALLRSTLEKTLKANGYGDGFLYKKSSVAAADGVITASRAEKAQELVRTLGNDVLHDEWRKVEQSETELAYHYVGRVVEDFYDDRQTVERLLISKNRVRGAAE